MIYPDYLIQDIEEVLRDFPDTPTRTLAKRLYKKHRRFFKDVEQARSALRRRRGNSGESSLKKSKFIRENQDAGWVPELPPSQAEEWVPYVTELGERIAVLSDLHFPYHCTKTLKNWYAEAQEYEPSVILLNGDILDFYRLSRYEKDPNKRKTEYELDTVQQFLDWLQNGFEAKIIWKDGNHDERWKKYLWNFAPEFSGLDDFQLHNILHLEQRGIDYVTDKRVIMAGDLAILHGHEMQGSGGSINPARTMASKLRHSALQGHVHRTSEYSERNFLNEMMVTYSTGCCCELNPDFSRINRWNHGYAFVETDYEGNITIENKVTE